jgi:hypothetical protein
MPGRRTPRTAARGLKIGAAIENENRLSPFFFDADGECAEEVPEAGQRLYPAVIACAPGGFGISDSARRRFAIRGTVRLATVNSDPRCCWYFPQ